MRNLVAVKANGNYTLDCLFDNGVLKVADVTLYLQSEVFRPLQDPTIFVQVTNNQNYVSWLNEQVDLSADTLWHIGTEFKSAKSPLVSNS